MNRIKDKQSLIVNLVILVAILIFLNLVSITMFKRFDLSKGKIYTLSKSSKTAVKQLPDRVLVKAYFTKKLPGQLADAKRFTQDILSEYQAYSKGKLRFEFIDPSDEEGLKEEARKNRITPVSVRVIENDKLEIREVFLGLAFLYKDKVETIPVIQTTQGLEYDITSTIKKITSTGMKKVAFFEIKDDTEIMPDPRNPYANQNDKYRTLRQMVQGNYELQDTDLNNPLDNDIETLICTSIADSLTDDQLFNIDQFLMKGGKLLVFQDKVTTELQMMQANVVQSNFINLLENYGISFKNNLVSDAQCGQIQIQRQQGIFSFATPVSYPYFPVVQSGSENVIVKNLDNMQFVFASELDTTKVKAGQNFELLLATSENSGETAGPNFDISYEKFMNKNLKMMLQDKPRPLAGIYTGNFDSYFANSAKASEAGFLQKNENGRIIVVADGDFAKEGAGAGVPGNMDFTLNAVDYLSSDSALIELRSRETAHKPLKELKPATKKIVKWLNILLPSILLILFGLFTYSKEMNRRKILRDMYE
jgi:gliding-associated putative ABC transporter substrate-binding component GldG